MGEVLEMMRFLIVAFVFAISLAACSSDKEQSSFGLENSYFSQQEYVTPPRFNSLFLEQRPVLDIEFVDLGVAGKLILEQQDGSYARYLSADLGGVILQRGLLHSLYGFGEPLVGAEFSQSLSLIIAGRSGIAYRFHTYVDGEDRTQTRTYRCEVSTVGPQDVVFESGVIPSILMSERCVNLSQSFENNYWVERSRGEVIQSRQWVGENIGSLVTRVTRPE